MHYKTLYRSRSQHLVILYQQFLGYNEPQGQRFESYFNLQSDITNCDGTLGNVIVEYASTDMVGDYE